MNKLAFRTLAGLSLAGALAAGTGLVHAQQQGQVVQARVVSATPVRETTGSDVSYNVTYEYNGQRYTTRMNSRPGATIPIQASGYGVTTSAVSPQSQVQTYPVEANGGGYAQQSGGSPWDNVVPEPGMVVGAGGPAPVYAPMYAQPAPVYAPAPVYVDPGYGYGYGYGYPYAYAPVGISLNLGYSRGWGGGGYYRGGGYRGYGGFRGGWHR